MIIVVIPITVAPVIIIVVVAIPSTIVIIIVIVVTIPSVVVIIIVPIIALIATVIVIVVVIIRPRVTHEVAVAGLYFNSGAGVFAGTHAFDFLFEDVARRAVIDDFELLCAADRLDLDLANAILDLDTLKPLRLEVVNDLVIRGLGHGRGAGDGCDKCGHQCFFHWFDPFVSGDLL